MPAPARNLTDTVVVVTGAAGGIGAAIARQALEAGAKVVLGDLKECRCESSRTSGGLSGSPAWPVTSATRPRPWPLSKRVRNRSGAWIALSPTRASGITEAFSIMGLTRSG